MIISMLYITYPELTYFIIRSLYLLTTCSYPPNSPSEFGLLFFWWEGASLVAQTVKRPPAMRETRVRFLGWEDPLEKEMAVHSSTLAWKIPWMEEPDRP